MRALSSEDIKKAIEIMKKDGRSYKHMIFVHPRSILGRYLRNESTPEERAVFEKVFNKKQTPKKRRKK